MIRKAIRQAFKLAGLTTEYHVCATYPIMGGIATITFRAAIKPWLHADNCQDLADYVKSLAKEPTGNPNIVCVKSLGI